MKWLLMHFRGFMAFSAEILAGRVHSCQGQAAVTRTPPRPAYAPLRLSTLRPPLRTLVTVICVLCSRVGCRARRRATGEN